MSITKSFYIFLASGSIATFFLIVILKKLAVNPVYKEFVVGYITWNGFTKLQDLLAGPFFAATFILFFWLFLRLETKINDFDEIKSSDFTQQLAWWSIPFILSVSGLLISKNIEIKLLILTVYGLVILLISGFYGAFKKDDIYPYQIGLTILATILIALLPLEIAIVISRLPMQAVGNYNPTVFLKISIITLSIGFFIAILLTTVLSHKIETWLPKLLFVSQLGLPLFFLALYPARLNSSNMGLIKYDTSIYLKIIIIFLIAWGIYDVVRRYQKYYRSSQKKALVDLLSPIALFSLLVVFKAGTTIAPAISTDDYHFGESLLGSWLYLQGTIPYIEYYPPHGFIRDDLPGLVNFFFYNGHASSITQAGKLAATFISLIGFFSLYQFSRNLGFTFTLFFLLPWILNRLIIIPFFILFVFKPLIQNPSRWLTVWILTAPVLVFFIPAQGAALVSASGIIALYCSWILFKFPQSIQWKEIAFAAILTAMLAIFTPLIPILMGAANYVLENLAVNQVAYGIPINLSWDRQGVMSGLIFEFFRNAWVFALIGTILIVYFGIRDFKYHWWTVLVGLLIVLFILLMIPYAMGRVDSESFSRPGSLSTVLFLGFIPVLLWCSLSDHRRFLGIIAAVFIAGGLLTTHNPLLSLKSSLLQYINTTALISGKDIGLNNIGVASVDPDHLKRLLELNEFFSKKLQPDETYIDLTNRNAQYFYLNRKPPVAVSAPYNMVPIAQQLQSITMIENEKPKLALFSAENITHDGGGLALRNPLLFRYIFNNYDPVQEGNFIIGYLKGAEDVANPGIRLMLLDESFATKNLGKIPVSWGRSDKYLLKMMHLIHTIDYKDRVLNHMAHSDDLLLINGNDPFINYDVFNLRLAGMEAGLLKFDFTCIDQTAEPTIQIYWWGDQQTGANELASLRFIADTGTLIIPLDSQPRWLDLKHVHGIRIDLDNPTACRAIKIENISLYQRSQLFD